MQEYRCTAGPLDAVCSVVRTLGNLEDQRENVASFVISNWEKKGNEENN